MEKYNWICIISYDDTTTKTIKGNVVSPPFAEDIERRVINLAKYEITPWLFYE
ncbi:hypothetical protein [Anaerocolumna jejuensis]|uniref:hypothetical protein n=1 Tax=Anaerocolumna jejuensis TaxID=259063 RepID=UPI001481B61A|nr:hypothetical protein [Anaerocolumna jejuensis]